MLNSTVRKTALFAKSMAWLLSISLMAGWSSAVAATLDVPDTSTVSADATIGAIVAPASSLYAAAASSDAATAPVTAPATSLDGATAALTAPATSLDAASLTTLAANTDSATASTPAVVKTAPKVTSAMDLIRPRPSATTAEPGSSLSQVTVSPSRAQACADQSQGSTPSGAAHVAPPQTTETVLPNGLKVVVFEDHSFPVASCLAWYKVGSRNESPGATGISHLLEHLLFGQVGPYRKGDIAATVARIGGQFNGYTSDDFTAFFETLPSTKLDTALRIESQRMRSAVFTDADVQQEVANIQNEFEHESKDAQSAITREVRAALYQQHPYHNPTMGWRSDVENLKAQHVKAYYDRFFWPDNCTLVIAGDVSSKDVVQNVQKYFNAIPKCPSGAPPARAAEPTQHGERKIVVKYPGKQEMLQVAYHGPALEDPDSPAMVVIEKLLNTSIAGRLKTKLVDAKVCSAAGASFEGKKDPGFFTVTCTAYPGSAGSQQKITDAVDTLISQLKAQPISDAELRRARNQAEFAFFAEAESPYRAGFHLGYFESLWKWQDSLAWPEKLKTVTAADVQRVARKYLNNDARVVAWLAGTNAPKPVAPKASPDQPSTPKGTKFEHTRLTGYKDDDNALAPGSSRPVLIAQLAVERDVAYPGMPSETHVVAPKVKVPKRIVKPEASQSGSAKLPDSDDSIFVGQPAIKVQAKKLVPAVTKAPAPKEAAAVSAPTPGAPVAPVSPVAREASVLSAPTHGELVAPVAKVPQPLVAPVTPSAPVATAATTMPAPTATVVKAATPMAATTMPAPTAITKAATPTAATTKVSTPTATTTAPAPTATAKVATPKAATMTPTAATTKVATPTATTTEPAPTANTKVATPTAATTKVATPTATTTAPAPTATTTVATPAATTTTPTPTAATAAPKNGNMVQQAIRDIPGALPYAIKEVPNAIGGATSTAVRELPNAVQAVPAVIKSLPSAVEGLPGAIKQLPSAVGSIPSAIKEIPGAIGGLPGAAVTAVKGLPGTIGGIPGAAASTIKGLPGAIGGIPGAAASAVMGMPGAIGNIVGELGGIPGAIGKQFSSQGRVDVPAHVAKRILKNGVTIVVYESHLSPFVQIDGAVRAGSAYDPVGKPGVAALVSTLFDQGTARRGRLQVQTIQEDIGLQPGNMLKFDDNDATIEMRTRCLSRDLPTQLDLIAETLCTPACSDADVDKAKSEVLNSLKARDDGATARINRALLRNLLANTSPFTPRDPAELAHVLATLTPADAKKFITSYVAPAATTIVLVGDIDIDRAQQIAEHSFASWTQKGSHPHLHSHPGSRHISRATLPTKDKNVAAVCFGQLVPMAKNGPEYGSLLIADAVFSTHPMISRLNKKFAADPSFSQALPDDSVETEIKPIANNLAWSFSVSVEPSAVSSVVQNFQTELKQLAKTGVSADEFAEARRYLMGSIPVRHLSTYSHTAKSLLDACIHSENSNSDNYFAVLSSLRTANLESVNRVIRNALRPDQTTLVVMGTPQSIRSVRTQIAQNAARSRSAAAADESRDVPVTDQQQQSRKPL